MSSLTWMDFSEQERRQALDLIDMFNETEARDELGIGTVRDALANNLFPGTSTIQTRAKYFLFIPWTYTDLEKKQISSFRIDKEARRKEIELIYALLEAEDTTGIIGRDARETLKRLPSNVYWQGLYRWGIRTYHGSQDPYHRSLDGYYANRTRKLIKTDDGDPLEDVLFNWHKGLPPKPELFPSHTSFNLSIEEASYLRDRVLHSVQRTMLAYLVNLDEPYEKVDFPWDLAVLDTMPNYLLTKLNHAKYFSFAIHGASLLYNLMLAELVHSESLTQDYRDRLTEWWMNIHDLTQSIISWNRLEFWNLVKTENARIPERTQAFVNTWLDIVITAITNHQSLNDIIDNVLNRQIIKNREVQLKKGRARLNQTKAQNWEGESGAAQLDFRWRTTQTITLDILNGLKGSLSHV